MRVVVSDANKILFWSSNAILNLPARHCHADSGRIVAAANPPADLEARRKALNDLLHEQWEYTMRTSPIYASILGDKRYNDKLDDFSQRPSTTISNRRAASSPASKRSTRPASPSRRS